MTKRAYLMNFGLLIFVSLIILAWNGYSGAIVRNCFIIPIVCSLFYATQIFAEEEKIGGRISGNFIGIVISITSLAMMFKFI